MRRSSVDRAVENIDESALEVGPPKERAVGVPAVARATQMAVEQMGAARTARTLALVNQTHGFDCPGCAWPEAKHRSRAEFCENGAKAVAEEATKRRVPPEFFAAHPVAELATWDDYSLGQQGRLTQPMLLDEGATHYRPVSWEEAYDVVAQEVARLSSPDELVFYTSGRTSNEAAFCWQLLARGLGTNNLPDCSNMCHESSGSALTETIGIGKGSVSLLDVETAELVVVAGQNPGTNHPRMLSALEKTKRAGGRIVAINPLREAGLLRFDNPQKVRGVVGSGTDLADVYLQVRLGGDQALFQALGALLLEAEDAAPGTVLDHEFLADHTHGFEEYAAHLRALDWSEVETATGLPRAQIAEVADLLRESRSTVLCWAMGLTQHKHSVPTLRDAVNLLLLQGNIGKPGAGVCPVRGHSNVQGDRTMGIFERMPDEFHDALDAEFSFASPRAHGHDTVAAIEAMRDGTAKVFLGMGGNFARATPDTAVTEAALASLELTVQVSTKLNRSHVVHGRRALILPTLGRTDRDVQATGPQRVTVEDSMSAVHASEGRLEPPSEHLRSEVAIITELAERLLAGRPGAPVADWRAFREDYATIRAAVERVVPGFEDFERRIDSPGGFVLPNKPRDERGFATASGRAELTVNALEYPRVPPGRLLLQTIRSHDQYNTTIYGRDDRYRGISGGRRVVFVHPEDVRALGLADGDLVDLVSEWADGDRRAPDFRVVPYATPRGCVAAYYPETNVLVPLGSYADTSRTPTSKSVVVRLEPVTGGDR
ncbi:FdhF/YdeP family oxidoreductase [Nocardioides sp. ChNu-153]|uniref:FdhF/YdeP family oxidoreductase n=1 Tax=unclassified Nocardioides TaxID=2615069 RepID=UPI002405D955|nr:MULTISPECIES: FdhF/YdeP family oxidoreductase [unclassified Nocardioides]MDF9715539.1 FdhF/YdeP family oxidoreductase [Nocardioides sp. ChNu-99]MDN7120706.1 FdhF/YdeP family oxidoreductase [Nocardioides sp. ChNu-153]